MLQKNPYNLYYLQVTNNTGSRRDLLFELFLPSLLFECVVSVNKFSKGIHVVCSNAMWKCDSFHRISFLSCFIFHLRDGMNKLG